MLPFFYDNQWRGKRPYSVLFTLLFLFLFVSVGYGQHSLYKEGKRLYERGSTQAAIPYFEKALRADSLLEPAYVYLSAAYVQTRQPSLSLSISEAGLQRFPGNLDLKWLKSQALFQQRRYLEARSILRNIMNKLRQNASLQWLNVNRGKIETQLAGTWQSQGARLLKRGQPDSAAIAFQKALNLQPDTLQHYINLAYAYLQQKNWDRALQVTEKGLNRFPDNGKLIKMKSRALYKKQNIDRLLEQYRRLHRKNPDDIEIALTYGQLLRSNGQPQKAAKFFDQLIKDHPRNPQIYRALIQMNERSRNYKGKLEILKRMRDNFPSRDTLVKDIALTYEKLKKWDKARASYDTLLTLTHDTLEVRQRLAETYRQQDSLKKAADIYKQLYRRYADNLEIMQNLGNLYEQLDRWPDAVSLYEQMIRRDTTNYALIHLGLAYLHTDQRIKAEKMFKKAIDRGSPHPRPRLELSRLIYEKDRDQSFRLAVEALEKSFKSLYEIQQKIKGQIQQETKELPSSGLGMKQKFTKYKELSGDSYRHLTTRYRPKRVRPVLQKMTGKYKESGRLHFLVGKYYEKQGIMKRALQRYRKAVRTNNQIRGAHLALGRYNERKGRIRKAIRHYENALTLDPKGPVPYGKLIKLYRKKEMLNRLCDRWMARYESGVDNKVLRAHLIEALHKANRFKDARKIVRE